MELNAGWETASSVRCLRRRLLCASTPSLPPAPPQHPEIKTDKNISSHFRTSRSLTLISLPWAFLLKNTFFLLPLSTHFRSVFFCRAFLFLSLHLTHSSSFVCLLSTPRCLGASRRCSVRLESDLGDRPTSRIRTSISGS